MFLNLSLPEPHARLMGYQESPAGRTATTVQHTIFRHYYPEAITVSQSLVKLWKDLIKQKKTIGTSTFQSLRTIPVLL